jgi:hypothetical protein
VETNFTGLSPEKLDALCEHARWQIHATSAVYGPIPLSEEPALVASATANIA